MPKSNSALNKFDKEPAGSIERKQYQELIANEFNDARSQVIKRLFEQTATYAEIFDKQQTLGNKVASFEIGKVLGEFKDSIERAKLKLAENEKKPFYEIFAKYSKLINTINAYINSTGARASDISGITNEVRNFAPQLNELFIEGIRKQNERRDSQMVDDDLINLNSLFDKIQSGYAEGQRLQGINLAGVVGVSESERKKLTEQLGIAKEMALNRPPGVAPFIAVFPSRAEELRREVELMERDPAYRDQVVQEELRRLRSIDDGLDEEYTRLINQGRFEQARERAERIGLQLPPELRSDRSDPNFFQVPAKVDGEFVAPPLRPRREESINFNVGRGSARGGRKSVNSEMARNYELIQRWSGFPYNVPPSAPPVVSKNPRSRVNVNTEGSGKKKGKKSGKPKYNDI